MEEGRVIGKPEGYPLQLKGITVEEESGASGRVSGVDGNLPEGIREEAGEFQLGQEEWKEHGESLMSGGFRVQVVLLPDRDPCPLLSGHNKINPRPQRAYQGLVLYFPFENQTAGRAVDPRLPLVSGYPEASRRGKEN